MTYRFTPAAHAALALLACLPIAARAEEDTAAERPADPIRVATDDANPPVKHLGVVTVTGGRRGSLPSQIPTTIEGITGAQVQASINATDSEDALKYLPSLLVRKRYAGDYNHAVLSTRASGTGNSARSLVYADGILLSNLLGNGASFAPRWGLVTPEEIERVDVLYGPFSAAYPGNSAGAVVDYLTRMPSKFEAHAVVGAFSQPFQLYGTDTTYNGWQASTSLGDRSGGWSWWVNLNRLDSEGQPLVFDTTATPTPGAVPDTDKTGKPWYVRGTGTQYRTVQDHLKLKLAYDLAPDLRASYTAGWWHNDAVGRSERYVAPVLSGVTNRDGLAHLMQALSLKQNAGGAFDWELAASVYDYRRDLSRKPAAAAPLQPALSQPMLDGGNGSATDLHGTGWNTLSARGTWRPGGEGSAHAVDAGVQQDSFRLRTTVYTLTDWVDQDSGAVGSRFDGNTRLRSVFGQDAWRFADGWMAVLGLRGERWQAYDGLTQTGAFTPYAHPRRSETAWSPKAALSHELRDGWVLKASAGRALRFPTVSELYQGAATSSGISNIANPDLRPERSWTSELSSEWTLPDAATLRLTLFHEDTRDALYSQPLPNVTPVTNSVQNVDHIRTTGLEAAAQRDNVWRGLDLQGNVTYADSTIVANSGYVSTPGDTVGKWQPRVPRWRASALAAWRVDERWTVSYGARYSGRQYGSLDNSDTNGFTYMGTSKYFTTDLRVRFAIDRQWHAAVGIDNLNNCHYWNFHPYPQRTYSAELRYDL
ncbi:TonB-dependent receptor [Rhizobacter sp. SG703]|uniref:TonB-dependent receptor n=1 Tax=Rhizobacter sp. SG703 TaxID=2587140 RepID=UPI0018203E69|nr:iron complex outermembrane receptor protein [Rhizobacter sp. SG703]